MARAALAVALTGGSLSLHLNGFRCQATTNAQRVTGSVACGSVGVACNSWCGMGDCCATSFGTGSSLVFGLLSFSNAAGLLLFLFL